MRWLLTTALLGTLLQAPPGAGLHNRMMDIEGVGEGTSGFWVPRDYDESAEVPLILALHPGGTPGPGYGMQFLRSMAAPGLQDWGAIIVAPDVPDQRWTNENSEKGVMAVLDWVLANYAVDRKQILVTGFSMGGAGTWYMASRHPDLFTAAIPMAARANSDAAEQVGDMPVFIIHARDDEVVPFEPAAQLAEEMGTRHQTVEFLPLEGVGPFRMSPGPLTRGGEWVKAQWAER